MIVRTAHILAARKANVVARPVGRPGGVLEAAECSKGCELFTHHRLQYEWFYEGFLPSTCAPTSTDSR
jgi:hypothetical protein